MLRRTWIFASLAGSALLGQNKSGEEEKKLSADELKELIDKKEIFFSTSASRKSSKSWALSKAT